MRTSPQSFRELRQRKRFPWEAASHSRLRIVSSTLPTPGLIKPNASPRNHVPESTGDLSTEKHIDIYSNFVPERLKLEKKCAGLAQL
jgi:hypothetical protein